jgi:prevent-host-death family protein
MYTICTMYTWTRPEARVTRRNAVVRRVSSRDARAQFADLIGAVYYGNETIIVERKGKPMAVVLSPNAYEALRKEAADDWARIDRVAERNADKSQEEVLADATAAVEAVRKARRVRARTAPARRR